MRRCGGALAPVHDSLALAIHVFVCCQVVPQGCTVGRERSLSKNWAAHALLASALQHRSAYYVSQHAVWTHSMTCPLRC